MSRFLGSLRAEIQILPSPRIKTLPPVPTLPQGSGAGRKAKWSVTQQDSATEGAYETNVKRSLRLTTALPSQHGTAAGKKQTGREAWPSMARQPRRQRPNRLSLPHLFQPKARLEASTLTGPLAPSSFL